MSDNYKLKNEDSFRNPQETYNSLYESLQNLWNSQNPKKIEQYTPTYKKGTIFMSPEDLDSQLNKMTPRERELELRNRNKEDLMFRDMKVSQLLGEDQLDSFNRDPMKWFLDKTGLNPFSKEVDINSEMINILNNQSNPFTEGLPEGNTMMPEDFR